MTGFSSDERLPGRATGAGTRRFAERFGKPETQFRRPDSLFLSSLALGTRRGAPGGVDDLLYRSAFSECLEAGVNVFDTALSDRMQTSERALGAALRSAIAEGSTARDEVVIVTKGGTLTPDPDRGHDYRSAQRDLVDTYVETALVSPDDVVNGRCIAPAFLRDQIDRSRSNLGLETLDLYLIEEPETHLREHGIREFRPRLVRAFEALEAAVHDGHIAAYGVCTWDGFLVPDHSRAHLSVVDIFEIALEAGGGVHHMEAIQLPYGLAMGEGVASDNQLAPDGHSTALLHTLEGSGAAVFASAPLYGGRLVGQIPSWVRAAFPEAQTDAQCALQFARSTANITSAVVGMRDPDHVKDNLALTRMEPAPADIPEALFRARQEGDAKR